MPLYCLGHTCVDLTISKVTPIVLITGVNMHSATSADETTQLEAVMPSFLLIAALLITER